MKRIFTIVSLSLIVALFNISCTSTIIEKLHPTLADGKYDSEFPYRTSQKQIEEIISSIHLVNCIAFYDSYIFQASSKITSNYLKRVLPETIAVEKVTSNNSMAGTATVIENNFGAITLLSVAHVVNFPDTILSYFSNPDGSSSNFIQSISIKTGQKIYIPDLPENGEISILAIDKSNDIVLLGKKYSTEKTVGTYELNFPWGNSTELEWGNFVYVFSYPMNMKMITKGIVSKPFKDSNSFLIDAVVNRGSSGGIVLAIRDGVPNFELVGLVRSMPVDNEFTIRPLIKGQEREFSPFASYSGDIYVDKEPVIKNGITKVIGVETIQKFIYNNKNTLLSRGYLQKYFSKLAQLNSQN